MSFQSDIGKKGGHGEVIAVSVLSWPLTPESIENEVWSAQIEMFVEFYKFNVQTFPFVRDACIILHASV